MIIITLLRVVAGIVRRVNGTSSPRQAGETRREAREYRRWTRDNRRR
jgi:hypothetical protein